MRAIGIRVQQCGNCGHHSLLDGVEPIPDAPLMSESCDRCARAALRCYLVERLQHEHAQLNPDDCTLHALEQLCRLAGATEVVTAGRTRRAIWDDLGRFILRKRATELSAV